MALALDAERYRRLLALLDQALDVAVADRDAWLNALPGEDQALVPRLRRLLAGHARTATGRQLDAGIGDFLPDLTDAEPDRQPGTRVAGYQLERMLGRGGMGSVWLARVADQPGVPPVALKLPNALNLAPGMAERMLREASILTTLNHPNIARTIRSGVTEAGQPYLAMEYVDGEDLLKFSAHHALDLMARLRLFLQVLSAVAHAHASLVLHRDLKPGNVLVNRSGQAKLLDFGIAKVLDEQGSASSTALTRLAGRAMTPDYASPEQVAGLPLTVASDVYALGVMLYELLTGERPYRLKRGSAAELEEAILTAEPQRPSLSLKPTTTLPGQSVHQTRRMLAGDLDTIILKCLKKKPAERYVSVSALMEDLQRFMEGRPVLARPDSRRYRMQKFIRRNWLPLSVGAAVSTSLVAGTAVALWQAREAQLQSARAVSEAARAQAALQSAQASEATARAEAARADAQAAQAARERNRAMEETQRAEAERLRAEAQRTLAQSRFEDVRGLAHSLIFEVHDSIQYLPGATDARAKVVEKGTEYLDKLAREPARDAKLAIQLAEGYEKLGWSMNGSMSANQGNAAKADVYFARALDVLRPWMVGDKQDLNAINAFARISLANGVNLQEQGRLKEAESFLTQGRDLRTRLLETAQDDMERNRDMAVADSYFANFEFEVGRLESAIALNEAVLKRFERMNQWDAKGIRNRWGLVTSHGNLGSMQKTAGRLDLARQHFRKSLELNKALEPDRPNHYSVISQFGWIHYLLGELLLTEGKLAEAISEFERSVQYRNSLVSKDDKDVEAAMNLARVEAALAQTLLKQGSIEDAVRYRDLSVTRAKALLGSRPNARRVLSNWVTIVGVTAGTPESNESRTPDCRWIDSAMSSLTTLRNLYPESASIKQLATPTCPKDIPVASR